MKFHALLPALLLTAAATIAMAQVASHAPAKMVTHSAPSGNSGDASMEVIHVEVTGKPVARVNGSVLTDRDLLHEMYALFPYAQQHNGFPKSLEKDIRSGAKQMMVFEELVYQDALRRKMTVAPEKIAASEVALRKQLGSESAFQQYIKVECNGDRKALQTKIRRSLLIDAYLKREVEDKAIPTDAELRTMYASAKSFTHGEMVHIQTVSVIPPPTADKDVNREAQKKAEKAYAEAKKTKDYKGFGLVAEHYSDDDWHVKLGDRKFVETSTLPPPLIQALAKMKPGDISPLIQLGNAYTFVRVVERKPAGKEPFATVRSEMKETVRKGRVEQLRNQLNAKLRQGAKVEEL